LSCLALSVTVAFDAVAQIGPVGFSNQLFPTWAYSDEVLAIPVPSTTLRPAVDAPLPDPAAADDGLFGVGGVVFGPRPLPVPRFASHKPPTASDISRRLHLPWGDRLSDNEVLTARLVSEVTAGSLANVRALLDEGADPNGLSTGGRSALVEAVRADQPRILRLLLARGANPNTAYSRGTSAVNVAIERDRTDLLDILLRAGASPTLPDANGMSPIVLAESLDRSAALARLMASDKTRSRQN
jgi:hypothetical protein